MNYIFDNLYTIIPDEDKYIIYCGNLRKAMRLGYSKMYLYKTIVENQSLMLLDEMLLHYGISKEDYESFIRFLLKKKIIFESNDEYIKEDYRHNYKKIVDRCSLLKAYLHVTQRCNLNCYYCYNKKNINSGRKELSATEWKKVIKDLYKEGVRDFVITGGEPTIRNDLVEILACIPKGCKVNVLTNGTLLIGDKLELLNYVDEVIVSLDSLENNNNDSNRQNSTNYNVIANIESLSEEQRKKIVVRSVITKNNVDDINKLKNYVQDVLKIKYITTGYLPNSEKEFSEFIPVKNEVRYKLKMNDLISCGACSVEIALDSNGDIYPCQSLIKPEFKIGNITDDDWQRKIREKKENEFHLGNINEIEKCKDCVYKYFCGNGCRAITYNIFHDLNRCNDYFCEFYKEKAVSDIKKLFVNEDMNNVNDQ